MSSRDPAHILLIMFFNEFLDQVEKLEQNFNGVDGDAAVDSEMLTGQGLRTDEILEDLYSYQ